MRLIHAADLHLDSTFGALSAEKARERRREGRFLVERLDYLRKGGRCSAVAALGANMLSLRPCIQVKEGTMTVGKKYTGNTEAVLTKYVGDRLRDVDSLDLSRIFVVHSGMNNPALVDKVKEAVLAIAPFEEVLEARAGCTISNHCGPNTLGVLFCKK